MGSPSGACSIPALSAFVQKEDVDNRTPLRIYYMIADCFLRRADIYREEKNIIDLCIMLMQFSSLMSETIPCHRDYLVSLKSERLSFEEKLLNALTELETLKPTVQSLIEEQNKKLMKKVAKSDQVQYPSNVVFTPVEMPRAVLCVKETLRRYPMLCRNGLNNLDFAPVEIPTPVGMQSLMSGTITCHGDHPVSLKREGLSVEEKLLNALTEIETLKHTVQSLIEEQNTECMKKV